jgi:hypothetical protein
MYFLWGTNWVFISQKAAFLIITAVKTSDVTYLTDFAVRTRGHRDITFWARTLVRSPGTPCTERRRGPARGPLTYWSSSYVPVLHAHMAHTPSPPPLHLPDRPMTSLDQEKFPVEILDCGGCYVPCPSYDLIVLGNISHGLIAEQLYVCVCVCVCV